MKISAYKFIPFALFILVIVAGVIGVAYVTEQEYEKLNIKSQITAEQGGIRLNDFIETRIERLNIFRERMEHQPWLTESEFNSTALRIQYELPGFQAINWIDSNGIIQWVNPLSDNLPVVGIDLLEKADKKAGDVFSRAFKYRIDTASPHIQLVQGGAGFATYLPIVVDDKIQGFINGVFRIEELISLCFNTPIKDFNYEVILSGQRVFLRGDPKNFENPRTTGRHNFTILGQSWELQIVPGSSSESTTVIMHIISGLVTLLIATLLAGFTYFRMKSSSELADAYSIIENSESKFRTIFDKSPACLVRYSSKGIITDWNLEASSLLGLEFPPKQKRSLYDLEALKPILPEIEKTFEGKSSVFLGSLEIQGKIVDIDAAFETLQSSTDPIQGGIILIKDVTEQNQTMRAKELMYEISEMANGIKDLPVLFKAIQESLSKILDTRNFYVALYDESIDEFSYPYYQDEFDSPPPEPIRGERGISAYVVKNAQPVLLTRDDIYNLNSEGHIDLLGTPSEQWLGCPLIVEGTPTGVMAVQTYSKEVVYRESDLEMMSFVSDQIALSIQLHIEDEKLRESEIMHRELSIQLSESNNTKALLLDILSHDLKNPAGVIAAVSDLLTSNEDVSEEIQLIKDSSNVLLKVIENTTSLAKITIGEEITMENMNLSNLIMDVVNEFQAIFKAQGTEVITNITPDISHAINPIIAEIPRNYLSNALKYAPKGEAIDVSLTRTDERIELCVADRGQLISKKDQGIIFQRSIQLENGKARGSGLGLAIVASIADVHGAKVGVRANTPTGNIFYLEIPTQTQGTDNTNEDSEG